MDLSGTCFVLIIPILLYPACLANNCTFSPQIQPYLYILIFNPIFIYLYSTLSFPWVKLCFIRTIMRTLLQIFHNFSKNLTLSFRGFLYDMFHPDHHLVWRWLFPMMSRHHRLLATKTHLKQRNELKTNRTLILIRQSLFRWELWLTLFDHVIF